MNEYTPLLDYQKLSSLHVTSILVLDCVQIQPGRDRLILLRDQVPRVFAPGKDLRTVSERLEPADVTPIV